MEQNDFAALFLDTDLLKMVLPPRKLSLRGFREKCTWSGTLCCVLEQGTLLSQCLSPPKSMNGYW